MLTSVYIQHITSRQQIYLRTKGNKCLCVMLTLRGRLHRQIRNGLWGRWRSVPVTSHYVR